MTKAVIFDMDGIVFDTEPIGFEATKKLLKKYGKYIKYKEIILYLGTGVRNYVESIAKKKKVNEDIEILIKKRKKYFVELAKNKLRVFPGIIKLIKELRKNKVKTALATSSSIKSVKLNCKLTKLNIKLFNVIVTRNYITKFKPDPEIFNIAIKKLKVKPEDCIVIEDSIAGIKAAQKAKTKVIAISNSLPKSKLKTAKLVFNSAEDIKFRKLMSLF